MWVPNPDRLVKILIRYGAEDAETPWAEDLGPAPGPPGARRVRLGNVPLLHAKPTYEDVILVVPDADGLLVWDRGGVAEEDLDGLLVEDAGRWLMILEFTLLDAATSAKEAFSELDRRCQAGDIAVEGCGGPSPGRPGVVCLGVPGDRDIPDVLALLEGLPLALEVVHPEFESPDPR